MYSGCKNSKWGRKAKNTQWIELLLQTHGLLIHYNKYVRNKLLGKFYNDVQQNKHSTVTESPRSRHIRRTAKNPCDAGWLRCARQLTETAANDVAGISLIANVFSTLQHFYSCKIQISVTLSFSLLDVSRRPSFRCSNCHNWIPIYTEKMFLNYSLKFFIEVVIDDKSGRCR